MSALPLPKVSFVMPVKNAAGILDLCLASIARQTYPRDRYEIILADAHSTDGTREIAARYGCIVLDDDSPNMEEAKRLALSHATGDYIVFVDADNELTHSDYIELAVRALAAHPQALGVESYYPASPRMTSFNAYLTHRLHISDPMCWLMSSNPLLVAREGEVERWTLPAGTYAYPLGANGFVYRRSDLEDVRANQAFSDTHVALYLMKSGKREWLRIRDRGVHHYYVQNWWVFLQKRRRSTVHFLNTRRQFNFTWTAHRPAMPGWLAGLYCVTFVGPLYHTLRGCLRDGDWRWFWHVPASFASGVAVVWGLWTAWRRRHERNLVGNLQPRQVMKP